MRKHCSNFSMIISDALIVETKSIENVYHRIGIVYEVHFQIGFKVLLLSHPFITPYRFAMDLHEPSTAVVGNFKVASCAFYNGFLDILVTVINKKAFVGIPRVEP